MIDIESYINGCVPHTLNEICESTSEVSIFFRIARVHSDVRIAFARLDRLLILLRTPSYRIASGFILVYVFFS